LAGDVPVGQPLLKREGTISSRRFRHTRRIGMVRV
jgi:trk system potassium uptake protein TrkA